MPRFQALFLTLSLATLSASAFGQSASQVIPGTLNYIEGQASIEGRPLSSQSVGNTALQAGQMIATANGKAEILLTPGIFLRLGDNSTIQMISTDLIHTEVRLEQGRASVEVDQIYPQNTILIDMKNGQTQILKNGLYAFDDTNSTVRVFDGKASVRPAANLPATAQPIELKGGRQLALTGDLLKPQGFNKDQAAADPFYKWSSLRSQYLGEANLSLAEQYAASPGFYPGWYWAGGPFGYTWLPGSGLFWSPFGYGFYSPFYIRGGGFIYGGYGRGFYGNRGYAAGVRGGAVRGGGGGAGGHR